MNGMISPVNGTYAKTKKSNREDDELMYTPVPGMPYGMAPTGTDLDMLLPQGARENLVQDYSRSMQALSPQYAMMPFAGPHPAANNYGPAQMMQGRQAQMPMYGNQAMVSIQYTAPDGSMYNIGFSTPSANKGPALDRALGYLKGIMMSEGKGYRGNYSNGRSYGGTSGRSGGYAGGGKAGGGYAGGKAGSGGGGGK